MNPFQDGDPSTAPVFTDPTLLVGLEADFSLLPRGEPRRLVAEVARSLAVREPPPERDAKLAAAGEVLRELNAQLDNDSALALAYVSALPALAREEAVQAPLAALELALAQLDEDDRAQFAPTLARAAVPARGAAGSARDGR